MVSKSTLKSLGFASIAEYFAYVLDSYINGNRTQVNTLLKDLHKDQRVAFGEWLFTNCESANTTQSILLLLLAI